MPHSQLPLSLTVLPRFLLLFSRISVKGSGVGQFSINRSTISVSSTILSTAEGNIRSGSAGPKRCTQQCVVADMATEAVWKRIFVAVILYAVVVGGFCEGGRVLHRTDGETSGLGFLKHYHQYGGMDIEDLSLQQQQQVLDLSTSMDAAARRLLEQDPYSL